MHLVSFSPARVEQGLLPRHVLQPRMDVWSSCVLVRKGRDGRAPGAVPRGALPWVSRERDVVLGAPCLRCWCRLVRVLRFVVVPPHPCLQGFGEDGQALEERRHYRTRRRRVCGDGGRGGGKGASRGQEQVDGARVYVAAQAPAFCVCRMRGAGGTSEGGGKDRAGDRDSGAGGRRHAGECGAGVVIWELGRVGVGVGGVQGGTGKESCGAEEGDPVGEERRV